MPLDKNPQRNKSEKSFIRYEYITQNKNTTGKPVVFSFSFNLIRLKQARQGSRSVLGEINLFDYRSQNTKQ